MAKYIPKITKGYTNIKGEYYNNIRQIEYKEGKTYGNFGKFICDNKGVTDTYDDTAGVYIFQNELNPKIGYRIYRGFNTDNFNKYKDDFLISELQSRQPKIKLTSFPTGVITLEGRIIGQEMPYYDNTKSLLEYSETEKNPVLPTKLYIQVLKAIKEMYENGIYYLDIHPKNFIVDKKGKVNVIDFEDTYVKFGKKLEYYDYDIFTRLSDVLNRMNHKFNIDIQNSMNMSSFEEGEEKVYALERKLTGVYKK